MNGRNSLLVRVFAAVIAMTLLAVPFAGVPILMVAVFGGAAMALLVTTKRTRATCARDGPNGLNRHNERRNDFNGFGGGPYVAKSKKVNAGRAVSFSLAVHPANPYQNRLPVYLSGASSGINSVTARLSSAIRGVRYHIIGRAHGSCRHLFHRESATLSLGYG